jgi:hypothetical protein
MKRSGVRRLTTSIQVSLGVATAVTLANCSGGERPPPQGEAAFDAGVDTGINPTPTVTGYDATKGISFGDDGFVNCGAQAGAQTVTLKNPSDDIVNFNASLTVGADKYKIDPTSGGIPANGKVDLQILPNPIPAASDVAADLYAGTLSIRFSTVDTPTVIRLHETARGAIIKTNLTGNAVDFGDVKVNTAGQQLFSITNSGNLDVTANFQLGTQQFKIDGSANASAPVAAGATVSKTLTFQPTDLIPYTDTLALTFNSSAVHCSPPPANVNVKGKGTSSVTVSPGVLNFGQVDCGTTANPQTLKISSTKDLNFTPTLGGGSLSKFTLADNTSGVPINSGDPVPVAANVDFVLKVIPIFVPVPSSTADNALGDTLTITTDAPGDQPHVVNVRETARGGIFAFGQAPLGINYAGTINQTANNTLTLVNSGNFPQPYVIAVVPRLGDNTAQGVLDATFSSTLKTGTAQVGVTAGTLITTTPSSYNKSILGALRVSAPGAVLCQDLPADMPISAATGAGTTVTTDKGALNFGLVDCGATYVDAVTAAPYQILTITTVAAAKVTPTLGKGGVSPYNLADGTGNPITQGVPISIAAGASFVMRVVPLQIPARPATGVTPNAFGDTLTLASDVDVNPINITLSETARGVIFAFSPISITCGTPTAKCGQPFFNYQLINSGNVTADYTLTVTGGAASNIPAPSPGSAPVGTTNGVLTGTGTGQVQAGSTSVLCADLPNMPYAIQ